MRSAKLVTLAATLAGAAVVGITYYLIVRRRKAKKPAGIMVACTGFGKFHGVSANPTEIIISALPSFLKSNPLPGYVRVDRCKVLEVSAEAVRKTIDGLRDTCIEPTDYLRLWLHLGVDSNSKQFKLERKAWNEADFRCADEAGWQPSHEPIIKEDGDIKNQRVTTLPVTSLSWRLRWRGHKVTTSSDPGRFVCNYTYYHSLSRCDSQEHQLALFVHCPPMEVVPAEEQLAFLHDLLSTIGADICT